VLRRERAEGRGQREVDNGWGTDKRMVDSGQETDKRPGTVLMVAAALRCPGWKLFWILVFQGDETLTPWPPLPLRGEGECVS